MLDQQPESQPTQQNSQQRKPHIVIFNPDQWRGDVLGHGGNPAAVTPHLDQLVSTDAVSFSNAFCQNPVCTPSRCSFMSGWYPHVRGHRTMHHMMRPDEPVLLRTLKDNGYFVWWGGKNDLVPGQSGFDDYCHVKNQPDRSQLRPNFAMDQQDQWRGEPGSDSYYSFYVGELPAEPDGYYPDSDWAHVHAAIDQIHAWAATEDHDHEALCLYLPLLYPHPPYAVEERWLSLIDQAAIPARVPAPDPADGPEPAILGGIRARQGLSGWSEDRWRALRATYYGMCARVDHQLGLVIQALREVGMYDDTALFFFSDHGDFTGDYGLVEKTQNTFADCLTRVPLVIKPPAGFEVLPGRRDALVELIDMPATVEEFTQISPQHTHFGRSLVPLLAGTESEHRDAVFCEGGRLRGERQAMELESDSNDPSGLYWPRLTLQAGDGPDHGKATMCRTSEFKYVHRLYEGDELYDLRTDPAETRNLINDPAYASTVQALTARMLSWYQETADAVPHRTDSR